jgi:hypothetical protein
MGLSLAALLIGMAGTAYGQGLTWPGAALTRMVEGARWRLGALRANAAFTLASSGYDSDVFYGYFGDAVPDWTFAAGAPVQILLPLSKNVVLDLVDTPQYLFYLDTKGERSVNNTFPGQIHAGLEKVYLQAGGGLSDVRRRFSPELDINVREKRDSVDGTFLWQASKAASIAILYERAQYDYGDAEYLGTNLSEMLSRDEDHVDVIAYIQPGPGMRLLLDGQFGVFAFTGATSGNRDAKSYGVFGGAEFIPNLEEMPIGSGLRGGFKLGYIRLDLADPGLRDGSGFAGEANVSMDLTNKTSLQLFFSRGFQFSIFSGATYYLATAYRAGLLQRLSRRAVLSYDVFFGRAFYPRDGDIQGRGDRFVAHAVSLDLRLARHLGVVLMGTFGQRARDGGEIIRDRYFIGLGLTYGFPGSGVRSLLGELVR